MTRRDSTLGADSGDDDRSRRQFLAGLGAAGVGGLAGCMGFELQSEGGEPPTVESPPKAVYYPTHVEGMQMVATTSDGAYRCALTYTFPHRFWTVTGQTKSKVTVGERDSVHLMPVVWHEAAGLVTPDVSPSIVVRRDGADVATVSPWPMLSQPMGFHFGDNVALGGEGTYQVEVSVGEPSARRTGALADAGSASFAFDLSFSQSKLESLSYTDIPEAKEGTRGAVPPMEMGAVPATQVAEPESYPGDVRGTGTSGDAEFVVSVVDDATPFGGGESDSYLAVSPRSPYNRYMLPMMSLSARLRRGGETVYDDILRATLDADLSYHYGAVVDGVESGDELTVTVDAPPQASRHEGYETAFFSMDPVELTL